MLWGLLNSLRRGLHGEELGPSATNGVREPPCKHPLCPRPGIQTTATSADTLTTTKKETLSQTCPAQPLLNF